MAAHGRQVRFLALFVATLTIGAAGIAFFPSAFGKLLVVLGLLGFMASFTLIFSIKSLERNRAHKGKDQPLLLVYQRPVYHERIQRDTAKAPSTAALVKEDPGNRVN